jgi:DNA-binding MarR family transcriptional regulator
VLPTPKAKPKAGPKARPKAGPERYLTYRLDVLSTGAIRIANEAYVASCGLEVRELRILRLIDDNPGITFSDLTEQTRFERSLASRLLNGLLRDGLVERENSATDARVFHLRTTEAGRERRHLAARIGQKLEAHLLRPLSEQQRTGLLETIELLTDWVYGDFAIDLDAVVGIKSKV